MAHGGHVAMHSLALCGMRPDGQPDTISASEYLHAHRDNLHVIHAGVNSSELLYPGEAYPGGVKRLLSSMCRADIILDQIASTIASFAPLRNARARIACSPVVGIHNTL